MNPRITLATAARVLLQLRRDPRTIALLLAVPCLLEVLLRYVLDGEAAAFQRIGAPLLGIFPFISMFLVTAITMLRERTTGTLERLMSMPLAKLDLLAGYGLAFGAVAAVQAALTSVVAFGLLDLHVAGSVGVVAGLAIANAVLGMSLGLFVSAFAATEFQAVQFMPAVVFPSCSCAACSSRATGWRWFLQAVSDVLPLTYAYDGLARVTTLGGFDSTTVRDLVVVVGATLLALALGATTLRRRTAYMVATPQNLRRLRRSQPTIGPVACLAPGGET